jgi:hypothetical protein
VFLFKQDDMHDYAGSIHFHSDYSYDGDTSLDTIVRAAQGAHLDFAVLTDHFRLDARTDGWERYYEVAGEARRLLLIVGEEVSPRYNHYLALGIQKPIVVWKNHPKAQDVIDAVQAQGGFGFIAHPDHAGAPLLGSRAFPWIDWTVSGFAGIAIWDLISDWSSALTSHPAALKAWLFPSSVLRGPRPETLRRWDALCQQGHCVAIGESDNHGHRRNYFLFSREIFRFEFAFRAVRTHVILEQPLTGDAQADQSRLLKALRAGQSYVSLDLWNDPKGFSFTVFDGSRRALMGDAFERSGAALVEAKLPGDGRMRLLRNGQVIHEESRRPYFERDVDRPGVYRLEADQHAGGAWRPWIYSNPIWVR